jgi:hypothetical protein
MKITDNSQNIFISQYLVHCICKTEFKYIIFNRHSEGQLIDFPMYVQREITIIR